MYSIRTCTLNAPLISEIQLPSVIASNTVLFLALTATALYRCGRVYFRLWSSNQPSVQKLVFFHFQLLFWQPLQKKDWTWCWAWIGKKDHAFSGSVFCSHSHLSFSAHPSADALAGRKNGAEGIVLCRTEHMVGTMLYVTLAGILYD